MSLFNVYLHIWGFVVRRNDWTKWAQSYSWVSWQKHYLSIYSTPCSNHISFRYTQHLVSFYYQTKCGTHKHLRNKVPPGKINHIFGEASEDLQNTRGSERGWSRDSLLKPRFLPTPEGRAAREYTWRGTTCAYWALLFNAAASRTRLRCLTTNTESRLWSWLCWALVKGIVPAISVGWSPRY